MYYWQSMLGWWQGCQLLIIAWCEKPKVNIWTFICLCLTSKKTDRPEKKRVMNHNLAHLGTLFVLLFCDAGDFACSTEERFVISGRFYMLGGREGEIVSRWETPSQCGRVDSSGGGWSRWKLESFQSILDSLLNSLPSTGT